MNNSKTQIFLSYKHHGENKETLPDYYMAQELWRELTDLGFNVFFAQESLTEIGQGYYKRVIDEKLDEAKMLIVVSTSPENCKSHWVLYEWDTFFQDLLSGHKEGELISFLDTNNIAEFPRTIRTRQVFEKKDGTALLIKHVKSYFGIKDTQSKLNQSATQKGSSYGYDYAYELGDERKRLRIQAMVESSRDAELISALFADTTRPLSVLDVGCSTGDVTFTVFEDIDLEIKLLGVDKFESCVSEFNANASENNIDNMKAEVLNFEDRDWQTRLEHHMQKHGIDQFDLVYCSLSLHHMSNSERILKELWKYIRDNGFIYVRTCDDALKIAYPNEEPIYKLIQKTAEASRVSDRFHGRKLYAFLHRAKFKNIQMKSFLVDTINKNVDERYALFYSAFVWRKNYFKSQLDAARSDTETEAAMREYDHVLQLLDDVENLFMNESFYFGYYITIGIAQKQAFLFE